MKHLPGLLYIFLLLNYSGLRAQPQETGKPISDTFPVPKDNDATLFYVQRTHNTNTIMYDVNYNADSSINEAEPVKIYWIRYADKGEIAPLSYLQRHYAYGINALMTDSVKRSFRLRFVSYKEKDIYLLRSKSGKKYQAFISINGKMAIFNKAFARIDGGTFMVPHITYVEISGKDPATGKKTSERIIP